MDLILLDSEEHIFISYQWDYQKTMLLVKTELESKAFKVWMDVDEMTGNMLQTIARAIEKSSVVLIAMSRKYQKSEICNLGSYIDLTELKSNGNCIVRIICLLLGFYVTSQRPFWCTEQWRKKSFWEFDSIIMQNLSDILPLFCTQTWSSHHISENQEYHFRLKHLYIHLRNNLDTSRVLIGQLAESFFTQEFRRTKETFV